MKYLNNRFRHYDLDYVPSTRKEAKRQGSDIYFTGSECKNGHVDIRNTKNATCYACARETAVRNYDPDYNKFYCGKYRRENRAKIREYRREEYWLKHDEILLRSSIWRDNNREKCRIYSLKYAHSVRSVTPKWADKEEMDYIYSLRVQKEYETGDPYEVDHIIPINSSSVCGLNCAENMRVVPKTMNRRKSNSYWPGMP